MDSGKQPVHVNAHRAQFIGRNDGNEVRTDLSSRDAVQGSFHCGNRHARGLCEEIRGGQRRGEHQRRREDEVDHLVIEPHSSRGYERDEADEDHEGRQQNRHEDDKDFRKHAKLPVFLFINDDIGKTGIPEIPGEPYLRLKIVKGRGQRRDHHEAEDDDDEPHGVNLAPQGKVRQRDTDPYGKTY